MLQEGKGETGTVQGAETGLWHMLEAFLFNWEKMGTTLYSPVGIPLTCPKVLAGEDLLSLFSELCVLPLSVLEAHVDCGAIPAGSSQQDPNSAPHCLLFPWEHQSGVLGLLAVTAGIAGFAAVPL